MKRAGDGPEPLTLYEATAALRASLLVLGADIADALRLDTVAEDLTRRAVLASQRRFDIRRDTIRGAP